MKKPSFRRYKSKTLKKLSPALRKPRGRHSKLRLEKKGKQPVPRIGFRKMKNTRNIEPRTKLLPKLVRNVTDLQGINKDKEIAVIHSPVGGLTRLKMAEYAQKNNVKILNMRDPKGFMETIKKRLDEKKKAVESKEESKKKKEALKEKKTEETPKEDTAEKLEKDKQKVLHKGEGK